MNRDFCSFISIKDPLNIYIDYYNHLFEKLKILPYTGDKIIKFITLQIILT